MFDTLEDCTIVRRKSRGKGRTARVNPCKNLTSRFRSYFSYIYSCTNTTLIVSFSLYIVAFGHVYFRDFNAFRRSAACFDRLMNLSGGHSLDIRRDRESYAISHRSPGKRRHSSLSLSFFPCGRDSGDLTPRVLARVATRICIKRMYLT